MKKIWKLKNQNEDLKKLIIDELNINHVIANIISNKKMETLEEVKKFLCPSKKSLHNPFLFIDMNIAVEEIKNAMLNNEKIIIYGDYDVDGVSSTILLMLLFSKFGYENVDFYIPVREEGYGINKDAIRKLREAGASLLISVDCGITSISEVELANELGLKVIITDHHEASENIPPAKAVLNPKRLDSTYPFKELAGVGVAYKLATALQMELQCPNLSENLLEFLDIVAFGSIADIVPLTDENRFITQYGLCLLNEKNTVRNGFKELIEVSGFSDKPIESGTVGYYLAPRINALGRLTDVRAAVTMFLEEDANIRIETAKKLNNYNQERQEIEKEMIESALAMLPEPDQYTHNCIVLADESWHTGVKGIVASKILEKYYKPIILCSIENGIASGSARSIEGINIKEMLDLSSDWLIKYGGHEMAAGMSFKLEDIDSFRNSLSQNILENTDSEFFIPKVKYDAEISAKDITFELLKQIDNLKPFGQGNISPIFAIKGTKLVNYTAIGKDKNHLKITIQQGNHPLSAVCFNCPELINLMKTVNPNDTVDIVCSLSINEWQNKQSIQLMIKDLVINPFKPIIENPELEKLYQEAEDSLFKSEYANLADKDSFFSKVVGVNFENRQDLIKSLTKEQELVLVREPLNEYDSNAIAVCTLENTQIGYLKAKLAKILAPIIDSGIDYICHITDITMLEETNPLISIVETEDVKNKGVNIIIERKEPINRSNVCFIDYLFRNSIQYKDQEYILECIKEKLLKGHDYRPKQLDSIQSLLSNKNTLSIMGTGRGKSAIFQTVASLKAIQNKEKTIILYPLRALVNDQLNSMQNTLSPLGISVAKATGDSSSNAKQKLFEDLLNDNVDIILTTPEFLEFHIDKFAECKISYLVVDEGHHIGQSTVSFRPSYLNMDNIIARLNNPLMSIMTATCPNQTFDNIKGLIRLDNIIIDETVRHNLTLIDQRNCYDKIPNIVNIIKQNHKTIIYVNARETTVSLAKNLRNLIPDMYSFIGFYHGGMNSEDRQKVEEMFRTDELKVIVTTTAFGEGVDIPNISAVVHFHMPFTETDFNQLSGRAGRNGSKSYIHLLFGEKDIRLNEFICLMANPNKELLGKIYRAITFIRDNEEGKKVFSMDGIITELNNLYPQIPIGDATIITALNIFKEVNLLTFGESADLYYIQLIPTSEKMDLTNSLIYRECQMELENFYNFSRWLKETKTFNLLDTINKPIFPNLTE